MRSWGAILKGRGTKERGERRSEITREKWRVRMYERCVSRNSYR